MGNILFSEDRETMAVICDCGDCEHQLILYHNKEEDLEEYFLEIHLVTYENIFQRILAAIKYIFGYKSKYGDWDSIIITPTMAKSMARFLDKNIPHTSLSSNIIIMEYSTDADKLILKELENE